MALSTITAIPIFSSSLSGAGLTGSSLSMFINGLTNGFVEYVLAGVKVSTVDVGTFGAGVGIGTVFLNPTIIVPSMVSSFSGSSILGTNSAVLATAIANAMSQCFSLAQASTISPTVGVGTGVGSLIPTSGTPFFVNSFASSGLVGIYGATLATAVANGLDSSLHSSIVNTVIAGPPSISPSTGIGMGFLI